MCIKLIKIELWLGKISTPKGRSLSFRAVHIQLFSLTYTFSFDSIIIAVELLSICILDFEFFSLFALEIVSGHTAASYQPFR